MSLKEYSREELEVKSMLEIANEILLEEHKAMDFNELYDKTAAFKGFTDEQKQEFIAQFYTDLTVDGRFLMAGSGIWGLKRWYPVDQMDEEVNVAAKKKTKKKKQQKETKKETKKEKEPEKPEKPEKPAADEDLDIDEDLLDDDIDELDLDEGDDFDADTEGIDQEFESDEKEGDDEDLK
ncbi:DNA-directed RNA polymerase subunit delta [Lentibacillus juripiscarius]|uniref:Probable DNA-directed RNA polymerase subunit delta n=1 Tax=Lentibacillus juripiscarius TaxID=257446 RepID=A0ABW5V8U2_9BACI